MSKTIHIIYISLMSLIVVAVTAFIAIDGYSYYATPIEDRFYHPEYAWFKPSGIFGQGLGVVGTFLILFGVVIYIARKRYGFMEKYLRLKYLLEFHIFLCTLGPIMVLFHTTFKFGGIVSVGFWSMVMVVLSGVIGRFIYIQIPRTIEGRELSLSEVKSSHASLVDSLKSLDASGNLISEVLQDSNQHYGWGLTGFLKKQQRLNKVKRRLASLGTSGMEKRKIVKLVKQEMSLARRIERLLLMQKLFKYWHVIHLPFAIIMLVIVTIHVVVTVVLGYRWIF